MAIVAAEARCAFRSMSTWLFIGFVVITTLSVFLFYGSMYARFSGFFTSGSFLNPQLQLANSGIYGLWISLAGAIALVSGQRTKDERARLAEVLDSKPMSNAALTAARFVAAVGVICLPLVATFGLLQVWGLLADASGWSFGHAMEWRSLFWFTLIDVPTVVAMWCSIVLLLAGICRSRIAVVLVGVTILACVSWGLPRLPVYVVDLILPVSNYNSFTSDFVFSSLSGRAVMQRISMVGFALGLVCIVAALHPRPDRWRLAAGLGIAFVVAGTTAMGVLFWRAEQDAKERESWLERHREAAVAGASVADIRRIDGSVRVLPGKGLRIDLDLSLRLPPDASSTQLFSLNPGMRVTSLHVDGTRRQYDHRDGLLVVDIVMPSDSSSDVQLSVSAMGIPDPRFAHLDAAVDSSSVSRNNRIWQLGAVASIFDGSFVALMPWTVWYPIAGANVDRDDPTARPRDFFLMDVVVEVPLGWLVAGPGRRTVVRSETLTNTGSPDNSLRFGLCSSSENECFRLAPKNPVSDAALVASRFERYAIEVDGVELELLLHPRHSYFADYFEPAASAIANEAATLFRELSANGLPFPFNAWTVVEVPSNLRGYRGGSRLGSALYLPGMFLVRETFIVGNTQRFEHRLRPMHGSLNDIGASKLVLLKWLLFNDGTGNNLEQALAHTLFPAVTGTKGDHAIAVEMLLSELAARVLAAGDPTYRRSGLIFSAHFFDNDASLADGLAKVLFGISGFRQHLFGQTMSDYNAPNIWEALGRGIGPDRVLGEPDLATSVMALRTTKTADAVFDAFGRERVYELLAMIRARHLGATFGLEDFRLAATALDNDATPVIIEWLRGNSLPGFLGSARVDEIIEQETGESVFLVRAEIRNGESAAGLVRLSDNESGGSSHGTRPVRVAGNQSVELEFVAPQQPRNVWLHTYLSLNREAAKLDASMGDKGWMPDTLGGTVIDDLDDGFRHLGTGQHQPQEKIAARWWRTYGPPVQIDHGLPVFETTVPRVSGSWFRRKIPGAWGRYRRTVALGVPGDGGGRVSFLADLPHAGQWALEYHLPHDMDLRVGDPPLPRVRIGDLGEYDIRLRDGGRNHPIAFHGGSAEPGWNRLGVFTLKSKQVRVLVGTRTSGKIVVADAIRWLPMREDDGSPAPDTP